jgi:hypothetical protein
VRTHTGPITHGPITHGPIRCDLRGHTIPLTTNFDSSRPVLPS